MFAEDIPQFDSASRVLLVAPHPDDEALACGVTLQRAVRAVPSSVLFMLRTATTIPGRNG